MCGTMTVQVEVWALTADENGIYAINGQTGPWEGRIIPSDSTVHWEVQEVLREHDIPHGLEIALHGTSVTEPGAAWPSAPGLVWTSWRPKSSTIVLTYLSAIKCPKEYVFDEWPEAEPVGTELADEIGQPASYDPAKAPTPRNGDVLFHLVRHLRFLADTDDDNRNALEADSPGWFTALQDLSGVTARMFHRKPEPVA